MGLHYRKHEQNYLNKLNDLLDSYNYDCRYSLIELLYHLDEFKEEDREDILFNLGGVLNHNLYWRSMNVNRQLPSGNLRRKIEEQYGSYKNFWKKFKKKALSLKGSGYTFLVVKEDGSLDITNIHNQDTPLLRGHIPLFNIDMWEHAYYINYENNKEEYIDNFEQIVDFSNASKLYEDLTI